MTLVTLTIKRDGFIQSISFPVDLPEDQARTLVTEETLATGGVVLRLSTEPLRGC
jgi:hypothetical protein